MKLAIAALILAVASVQTVKGYSFTDSHGYKVTVSDTTIVTLKGSK